VILSAKMFGNRGSVFENKSNLTDKISEIGILSVFYFKIGTILLVLKPWWGFD